MVFRRMDTDTDTDTEFEIWPTMSHHYIVYNIAEMSLNVAFNHNKKQLYIFCSFILISIQSLEN